MRRLLATEATERARIDQERDVTDDRIEQERSLAKCVSPRRKTRNVVKLPAVRLSKQQP